MVTKRVLFGLLLLALLLVPAAALGKETATQGHTAVASSPALALDPVPIDRSSDTQALPAVAANPACPANQQFLVVYQSRVSGTNNDIWGRYVEGSGTVAGPVPFALTNQAAEQQAPAVATTWPAATTWWSGWTTATATGTSTRSCGTATSGRSMIQ